MGVEVALNERRETRANDFRVKHHEGEVVDEFAFKLAELFRIGIVADCVTAESSVRNRFSHKGLAIHYGLISEERVGGIEIYQIKAIRANRFK